MKATQELPRIDTANIAEQMKQARAELLAEAAKHLGYRSPTPTDLLQQLMALAISPFRTSAVEEYKTGKESTSMYSGTRFWLLWFFSSVAAFGLSFVIEAKSSHDVLAIALGCAGGLSIFLAFVFGCEFVGQGDRTVKKWKRVDIRNYDGAVPDHVLGKALEIKRALPDCSLLVDYLDTNREHHHPDPFLYVKLKDAGYYVEQWDERDFPQIGE